MQRKMVSKKWSMHRRSLEDSHNESWSSNEWIEHISEQAFANVDRISTNQKIKYGARLSAFKLPSATKKTNLYIITLLILCVLSYSTVSLLESPIKIQSNINSATIFFLSKTLDAIFRTSAIFIFLAVNVQWWASRREISFDKYYEKLSNINKSLVDWRSCRWEGDKDKKENSLYEAMMYSELDTLEYTILKYRLGYLDDYIIKKSLNRFVSICVHRERFKQQLSKIIGTDGNKSWLVAYLPETYKIVASILEKMTDPAIVRAFEGTAINPYTIGDQKIDEVGDEIKN